MKSLLSLPLVLAGIVFFTGCKNDDPPLPDNTISFSSSELGFESAESSKALTLSLDRALSVESTVKLTLTEEGLVYGTDYTTDPAAVNGEVTVTIPAGQTAVTVTVKKVSGALFVGDEKLTFSIGTPSAGIVKGAKEALALTFGTIISTKGELTLNGGEGGAWAINSVFVDLSNNEQTSVPRNSWNLGLYSGDGFAVKLNGTLKSSAKEAGIGIDAVVTSADSVAYAAALAIDAVPTAFDVIDSWTGDLTKTVIKEGKVYIVNPGVAPLYKVKVTLKDANTYTVQYAKINESKVTSIDVAKNSAFNFKFISFSTGKEVSVEPAKAKWDIMWSNFLYRTYNSAVGADVPYLFPDVVIINKHAGVQVAEVTSADAASNIKAYDAISLEAASKLTFSSSVDAIGSKWRATPNVKDDRFYIIKDSAGNYYKLMFISMGDTRGYPKLKYELLK